MNHQADQKRLIRRVLTYPLLLLALILVVDKLALIPGIQEAGRKPPTPMENLKHAISLTRAAAAADPRPEVVVLGTSRTKGFQHLHPSTIAKDTYTNQQAKKELLAIHFETGTILPAAEMLVQYVYLREYLRHSVRPRLIVLEVSPGLFNRNTNNNLELFFSGNVFDYALLLELATLVQPDRWPLIGTKVTFASYANGFRPENAVRNLLRGRDYRHSAQMAIQLIMLQPRTKIIPDDYTDLPEHPIPTKEYQSRIVDYTDYMEGLYLRRHQFDQAELALLGRIIDSCQKAGQPLMLWRPRVHPLLEQREQKLGITGDFAKVESLIRKKSVPYYDASADPTFACRRHRDSSHLSARCMPHLMHKILSHARVAYPGLL